MGRGLGTIPRGVTLRSMPADARARKPNYRSQAFRQETGGQGMSRTGTAQYFHWRKRVLTEARNRGVTHCPFCHCLLDYERTRLPNSAEPDHILPVRWGGKNTLDNGRVICRRCNQSRGSNVAPKLSEPRRSSVDVDW